MGCSTCSNGGGLPKGCRGNGQCGTDGCNPLTVFDWLADMDLPGGQKPFDWVEVRFKNGRKEFFKNDNTITLHAGDTVAVQAETGHDIGVVAMTGELVRLQMRKKKFRQIPDQSLVVYRKASQKDIDIWQACREKEHETMLKAREIASRLELVMKISDVEFQGDGSKATFYYTAEERVDFRQLIREMASLFNVRIDMRQIGARQEASRLGGIGSCGRELCCSTWLTDFRSVSTAAARYQQLSLNPTKLAGQCGKLKCCLNYELDSYLDALKDFPNTQKKIKTGRGEAMFMKMDIFQGTLWYAYVDESVTWVPLHYTAVREIAEMNARGEMPASLEERMVDNAVAEPEFDNVVGQDDIGRFDRPKGKGKRRKKPQGKRPGGASREAKGGSPSAGTAKKDVPKAKSGQGSDTPQKKGGKRRSSQRRRGGGDKNKPTSNA